MGAWLDEEPLGSSRKLSLVRFAGEWLAADVGLLSSSSQLSSMVRFRFLLIFCSKNQDHASSAYLRVLTQCTHSIGGPRTKARQKFKNIQNLNSAPFDSDPFQLNYYFSRHWLF